MQPKFETGDIVRFNLQKGDDYEQGINNYDAVLVAPMPGSDQCNHYNHNCWYVRFLEGPFSEGRRYGYNVHQKFLRHKQNYPKNAELPKGGLPIL